jgi:penicillin-binding protein-related factor A (putative recombinase)
MTNNKTIGKRAEYEFASLMFKSGWWVHIFAQKAVGQPFDCVCANQGVVWFVDVKNVQDKDYLLHSRFESNQINAMTMLSRRGFDTLGFVCLFSDGWYLLRFKDIDFTDKKTTKDKMIKFNQDISKTFL